MMNLLDVFEQTPANIADTNQSDPKGAVWSVLASFTTITYCQNTCCCYDDFARRF